MGEGKKKKKQPPPPTKISINRHHNTSSSLLPLLGKKETAPHVHAALSGDGAAYGLFSQKFPTSAGGDPSAGLAAKRQSQSSVSPEEENYIPNGVL